MVDKMETSITLADHDDDGQKMDAINLADPEADDQRHGHRDLDLCRAAVEYVEKYNADRRGTCIPQLSNDELDDIMFNATGCTYSEAKLYLDGAACRERVGRGSPADSGTEVADQTEDECISTDSNSGIDSTPDDGDQEDTPQPESEFATSVRQDGGRLRPWWCKHFLSHRGCKRGHRCPFPHLSSEEAAMARREHREEYAASCVAALASHVRNNST